MAFGAEFYNDTGKLQLAAGVSNFYLSETGSLTPGTSSVFTITPSSSYDAIAIRCVSQVVPKAIFADTKTGGTSQSFRKIVSTTDTIYWYAFRSYQALTPASSGYGLEIFNADGTLGFTTQQPKLMRSHSRIAVPNGTAFSQSLPSGKVFAFISYGVTRKEVVGTAPMGGGSAWFPYGASIAHSDGTVGIDFLRTGKDNGVSFTSIYTGGVLAIDVTGY